MTREPFRPCLPQGDPDESDESPLPQKMDYGKRQLYGSAKESVQVSGFSHRIFAIYGCAPSVRSFAAQRTRGFCTARPKPSVAKRTRLGMTISSCARLYGFSCPQQPV
jgi:hypothetical protein